MKPTDAKFLHETVLLAKQVKESMIVIGGRLIKIKEQGLWKGTYNNWEEFVTELDMSPGSASKVMTVYREWVENAGFTVEQLSQAGVSKLYAARELISQGKTEALETALTLRRDDIEKTVRGEEGEHECNLVTFCTICRRRVYDAEEEH